MYLFFVVVTIKSSNAKFKIHIRLIVKSGIKQKLINNHQIQNYLQQNIIFEILGFTKALVR